MVRAKASRVAGLTRGAKDRVGFFVYVHGMVDLILIGRACADGVGAGFPSISNARIFAAGTRLEAKTRYRDLSTSQRTVDCPLLWSRCTFCCLYVGWKQERATARATTGDGWRIFGLVDGVNLA